MTTFIYVSNALLYLYMRQKKKGLKNIQIVAYQVRNQGYQVYLCICNFNIFYYYYTYTNFM